MRPRARITAGIALVIALVVATSPAWRVLLLGPDPTVDELFQLRCSAPR